MASDRHSRSKIDSDLRFSLGGAMTVFEVKRNNAEARIKAMLDGRTLPPPVELDPLDNTTSGNQDAVVDLATPATDQIIDFISRKFRGMTLLA